MKRVILLIETSRAFGRDLLYGVARYSRINGPWEFYRDHRGLKSSIPRLKNFEADGIIMRNSVIRSDLMNLNLPTILALHEPNRVEKMPAIITESESIVRLAVEHLISKGLKDFAYCGWDDLQWSNDRKYYFEKILKNYGHDVHKYKSSKFVQNSWSKEQVDLKRWLISLPKPIGIMACNDDRAQQVLDMCKILEFSVPDEVSVIGVDNDVLVCELSDPPLSSVALNTEKAGYYAAEALDRMMRTNDRKIDDIIVSASHVVKRESTDIYAMKDKDVIAAIRFIKENARNKIYIQDVVDQTCLGRRTLELRFRKLLNRTINEEISRIRNELIKTMLIETNLSISEITGTIDFIGPEHISRFFKKENGVSLQQFRKQNKCI
ncbi:MAG: DNA-binding transcriptional regulator [Ignavibacteriales bacterium]|nr:DNA-binding transcriptional regulator [Ignavibacteriales bacterium]